MTETRAALRERRKERMAQYAKEDGQKTLAQPTEIDVVAPSADAEPVVAEIEASVGDSPKGTTVTEDGQTYVEQTAPTTDIESTDQRIVAEVNALEEIQASASVDMVLFQYDEENPAWAVFANGEPVAKICLEDQPNSADVRSLFLSQGYAETVKKACTQDGLQMTLDGINARPYVVAMERSAVVADIRKDLEIAQADSLREKQAEAAQDLMSSLGLVINAMNKGFILDNPLKDALYQSVASVGVATPVQAVEAAFEEAGPAFFEAAIAQAREWAAYSPEAYKQIEDSVHKAAKYTPADSPSAPTSPQLEQQQAFPNIPLNVPLDTKTAGPETMNRKAALRQRLSLK